MSIIRTFPDKYLSVKGGLNPNRLFDTVEYKREFKKNNPNYFDPFGTLVFSGSQGYGKTLSAVDYILRILADYPYCVLVTNTDILGYPPNAYLFKVKRKNEEWQELYEINKYKRYNDYVDECTEKFKTHYKYDYSAQKKYTEEEYVNRNLHLCPFNVSRDFEDFISESEWEIHSLFDDHIITQESILSGVDERVCIEYWGLDTLKFVSNGKLGVLFFIDEIHLELNSLESKNISVDIITEISQQRKQRKHIVGTSQRYMRMAKPLREQIRDIVICRNFFSCIQFNKFIDGDGTVEKDGKLECEVKSRHLFFHSPEMYLRYDTYAKMRRYKNEWKGIPLAIVNNIENTIQEAKTDVRGIRRLVQ